MTYSELRRRGRESLRNFWVLAVAVAAVAWLLGNVGTSFIPDIDLSNMPKWLSRPVIEIGNLKIRFQHGILGFVAFLIGGTMELGYTQFFLKLQDGIQPDFSDLFSQFYRFGTGFTQRFLRGLYIFLWSLLLIIPGIVKGLSYAMTPYILAENPDMTASEAINRSKEMMEGHKGELFILGLTFIGWALLAALTLNLGNLLLNPYRKAAETAFYREVKSQYQHRLYE